jgi:hypothetical protein
MTSGKNIIFAGIFVAIFCSQSLENFACFAGPPSDDFKTVKEKNAFISDFNRTEAVFIGKVVSIDGFLVTFEVGKVWKGELPARFTMSTGKIKMANNSVKSSSCDYDFENGKSYLVFARHRRSAFSEEGIADANFFGAELPGQKHLLVSSQAGRTKPLEKAKQAIANLDQIVRSGRNDFE